MNPTDENFEIPGMWFELKEDNAPRTRVWIEQGELATIAEHPAWPFSKEYEAVSG